MARKSAENSPSPATNYGHGETIKIQLPTPIFLPQYVLAGVIQIHTKGLYMLQKAHIQEAKINYTADPILLPPPIFHAGSGIEVLVFRNNKTIQFPN